MKSKMTNDFIDLSLSKTNCFFARETFKSLAIFVKSLENSISEKHNSQLMCLFRPPRSRKIYSKYCIFNQLINVPVILKLFYRSVVLLNVKDKFSYLHTIDICNNTLSELPDEFCILVSLKECYLSHNKLFNLPIDFGDLRSLSVLHLNNNNLCDLPLSIENMSQLTELDLYDNDLREFPIFPKSVLYLDVAQNYAEEPDDILYLQKRERFRCMLGCDRENESKIFDYNGKYYESDEEYEDDVNYNCNTEIQEEEDWETDEYWDPSCRDPMWPDARSVWENFVTKVQNEGGFVPSDLHVPPTEARVTVVKLPVVSGQFDDD